MTVPSRTERNGVDARTDARLVWVGGASERTATISCSLVDDERQRLVVHGTSGSRTFDAAAFPDGVFTGGDPYRPMVDAFCAAVRGESEWPRPPAQSIEMLALLDRIRGTAT